MTSPQGTYDTASARSIKLVEVIRLLQDAGASRIFVKKLASNDNSKNQPYFGSHLTELPFIPTGHTIASNSESGKTSDPKRRIKYQVPLTLIWVDTQGHQYPAPRAKLIYYPQYPEVRFSGFLKGSRAQISRWMSPEQQGRSEGRWLMLGVAKDRAVYAYMVTPEHELSSELENADYISMGSVFRELDISHSVPQKSTRELLLEKLLEIHLKGWIPGQKMSPSMALEPYRAANGGGYTLEAMLGIPPNSIAEPDYLGWEVKQFGVLRHPTAGAKPTTLMTPEPDGGYYVTAGVIDFVKNFGYEDRSGKVDRMNFGGKHVIGKRQPLTNLTMQLTGFDHKSSSIYDARGAIVLLDAAGNDIASWTFAKLMDHWKRKHSQAVYIPCMRRAYSGGYEYQYGKNIELGIGTDFETFLAAMHIGTVFYDPGVKVENISSPKPKTKRRSQFRVNHKNLQSLYDSFEFIELDN